MPKLGLSQNNQTVLSYSLREPCVIRRFCLKNGLSPKKNKAGKKCMGIAKPVNSSGNSTSNGKVILNGARMLRKVITIISTFTQAIKLDFLNRSANKYEAAISKQAKMHATTMEISFITALKSRNIASS